MFSTFVSYIGCSSGLDKQQISRLRQYSVVVRKIMNHLVTVLAILTCHFCYSQEKDIFQNDSIYMKNKIAVRIMYSINDGALQKEMVTQYNSRGQIIKQYWFWNGDSNFHNVETFYYSTLNLLTTLIDSFSDGSLEKTRLFL